MAMAITSDKTILVVDDEPDILFYLQTVLEDAFFKVITAQNGDLAILEMQKKKPDLISLDLVMPQKTGFQFYNILKKNKEWAEIPVIIVTAHAKDEFGKRDIDKLFGDYAANKPIAYIDKPVKPEEYIDLIKKTFEIPIGKKLEKSHKGDIREEINKLLKYADNDKLERVLKILK
jgi:CheY-like chemotaxis protein